MADKKKEVFVRLGSGDIVITKTEADNISKYVTIKDNDGKFVGEVELYFIGHEFEDGKECDEDGSEF